MQGRRQLYLLKTDLRYLADCSLQRMAPRFNTNDNSKIFNPDRIFSITLLD